MGSYADSKYAPQDKCYAIENTTKFYKIDFTSLKAMVSDAKPETVAGVAHAWEQVHNTLVVDNGGGIRAYFDKAIDEVLQHWEGDAAQAFRVRAKSISESIGNGALYAKRVSDGMGRANEALSAYKQHLDGMEMPDWGDRAWDWATDHIERQDKNADAQLAGGKSATQVVKDNEDDLSAQKETQLKAAATMEYLGAAYRTNAVAIGKPKRVGVDDDPSSIPPPDNPGVPPVHYPLPAVVTKPKGMSKGSMKPMEKGPGFSGDGVKTPGISGGIGNTMPAPGSLTPHVGTGLESLNPPQGGVGPGGGSGGIPGGGGIGPGTGGMSGGTGPGGGTSPGPGGLPGVPGGMKGATGGRTGGTTGSAGGRTGGTTGPGAAGRGTGRAGMPGMGGVGAAGGKGGAKGGGAGRGLGLARQKGGVIGGGTEGKGTGGSQGGSGLHRSRGGAQAGAGASGSRRSAGMSGMHGAHGAKGKNDKGQNGERPDYLVEDEETWATERDVAPKVIE
ncbi:MULTISPECIES: hypothetical protein [unclassified Streptomyces]|uniref:hypothetical protein n=1 Tax=unclassified Streptomyces TaxID=2593676 RepID=UPI000885EEFE|nr:MULTISPECIES: hypothetical protein [unclassified Streptomyces]PBC85400.1 hypothetical protein BX261_5407 [Streptomyces sp. 2321.6]SDR15961.1 hypothetical protein SAMN05216511_1854 [Streptomyces sp. KS_16]SED66737.1 hypothetical protein SAMN05428940_5433 [Streptomyces sp. 2133.1]SNC71637.1 hypothetical protein SAMN06272741_5334 [Streptomyces sp. 2114.4]